MEHRDTLCIKSELATALKEIGQLEEAEKMFRTTLHSLLLQVETPSQTELRYKSGR